MSTDVKELFPKTTYKPEEIVKETRNYDRDLIKNTVEEVRAHDRSYTVDDATPPMQQKMHSPELEAVGAETVGDEKFEFHEEVGSKKRDFRNLLKAVGKSIVGGGNKIRHAPGKLFSKIRKRRISEGATIEDKYDPNELDIGN